MSILSSIFSRLLFLFLRVSGQNSFPPPLDGKTELEYFRRMKDGDREARDLLIEHNLRLVAHIAKKYYHSGTSQDDLMSLGTIGLIKAVDSFQPEKGIRFATYAARCLHNEILMYFRSQKKLTQEVSLSETIDTDHDGNPMTFSDVISTEDTIAEDVDLKIRSEQVRFLIRTLLDDRERQILVLRYGLHQGKPLTQREIAEKLGISRSYVSRIEKSAMEKIKNRMEA